MSTSQNNNSDGNDTTTLAVHTGNRAPIVGCDEKITEGRTETLDGQTTASDGQSVMPAEDAIMVASGDHMVTNEQSLMIAATEEAAMVVSVDPEVCPLSAFVSADEAVLSDSSGTPLKTVPATPVTPCKAFLSPAESSPGVFSPGHGENKTREASASAGGASVDMDVGMSARSRRVAGRRKAVVEDDGETQTLMSATSADEASSMAASSSRARNKGVKRKNRRTEKDKDRKYEETIEEWNSEEKKKKRKGKKKEIGKKDTPEELSNGKCGEPKGVVELVFEDMTSAVLGGAILEWINRIDEIRVKSKNFQGKLSGEMKKCAAKIKEGTALLVTRSEATGDPHFLRMRNSELATQLRGALWSSSEN